LLDDAVSDAGQSFNQPNVDQIIVLHIDIFTVKIFALWQ